MKKNGAVILAILLLAISVNSCDKYELVPLEERLPMFEWRLDATTRYYTTSDSLNTIEKILVADLSRDYQHIISSRECNISFTEDEAHFYDEGNPYDIWDPAPPVDVSGSYTVEDGMIEFEDTFEELFYESFGLPEGILQFRATSYSGALYLSTKVYRSLPTIDSVNVWYCLRLFPMEDVPIRMEY